MVPVQIRLFPEPHWVEWAEVSREQLTGAIFDVTSAALPVTRTGIEELAEAGVGHSPSGFIFHASRCGSTMLANALGAITGVAVISEAQPVGEALTHGDASMLRAVIAAMGNIRNATRYVVKFRSGDTLQLATIRAAWPDVPWLMLCRAPVEIIVSNLENPSGWLASKRRRNARMTDEHYCASTLGHFYNRAAACLSAGRGQVMDYEDLNLDGILRIGRYFGLPVNEADQAAIAASMEHYSKNAERPFLPDSSAKRDRASSTVLEMAAKFADAPYSRLRAFSHPP